MTAGLIALRQTAAIDGESGRVERAAPADGGGFGTRARRSRPEPVDRDYQRPSDRRLATEVTKAIATLQDAVDSAVRAGLIVEPNFQSVGNRFNEFGVSVDSYIFTVAMYRKLA